MKKERKTYIFDMDETICNSIEDNHRNYYISNLIPNKKMISIINRLYDEGNEIWIYTGRGAITEIDWKKETESELNTWGVKYHKLEFIKKPLNYLYVDDKACSPKEFISKYG